MFKYGDGVRQQGQKRYHGTDARKFCERSNNGQRCEQIKLRSTAWRQVPEDSEQQIQNRLLLRAGCVG